MIGGLGRLTHHHAVDVLPNFRGENIEDKKDITIFKFCTLDLYSEMPQYEYFKLFCYLALKLN